jgi:hypothetical protein
MTGVQVQYRGPGLGGVNGLLRDVLGLVGQSI